ncbi:MAG: 3-isopropylmalate dehydrogenase [Anaerotignum sp.]|nr:3-isopropylmalate dehydrogenase [Lachnospiraceae bacterium]MBP3307432.1 3-isopropylmalate dehydrogenase [Anaerotignum sp.]
MTEEKALLQWHPAFYASLQIELAKEAEHLEFENEHTLGTKPMQIDVLIIKKNTERKIKKNIGQMFRKHNIIEYKSPGDYLCIDDFYKVFGYACFYKSDTGIMNEIKAEEITISYVCSRYPREMMRHCRKVLGLQVVCQEQGIYYISGAWFPIQLIVTKELTAEENLWLKSLTKNLKDTALAERLIREYEKHQKDKRYTSVMELVVRANAQKFSEVKNMCNALKELMKDEFEAVRQESLAQGISQGSQKRLEELVWKKIQKNKTVAQIAEELESEQQEILPLYNRLKQQMT